VVGTRIEPDKNRPIRIVIMHSTPLQAGKFNTLLAAGTLETLLQAENKAKVISTDLAASNAVIHIIDTVLLPK
jgi:uncharacterized surface protein with fasciclin (FAS1) repeats